MKIIFERNAQIADVVAPSKGHQTDSGFDIFTSESFVLKHGERRTIPLQVRFALEFPWYMKFMHLFGIGIEAQVRPKSGRSKNGIEISLGTIDEGYRNFTGATVANFSGAKQKFEAGEKICQIVFVPVFNRVTLKEGTVSTETSRGLGGFGSTGLKSETIKQESNIISEKLKYYVDKIWTWEKNNQEPTIHFINPATPDAIVKIENTNKSEAKMPVKNSSKPGKGATSTKKIETPKDPKMVSAVKKSPKK